jgi:hypothetical protein
VAAGSKARKKYIRGRGRIKSANAGKLNRCPKMYPLGLVL